MENRLALSSDARSRLVALARAQPHRVGAWYLQQNPDVKKANMTPLTHWMQFGCLEGREPWEGAFRELLGPEPVAPPPVGEDEVVKRRQSDARSLAGLYDVEGVELYRLQKYFS